MCREEKKNGILTLWGQSVVSQKTFQGKRAKITTRYDIRIVAQTSFRTSERKNVQKTRQLQQHPIRPRQFNLKHLGIKGATYIGSERGSISLVFVGLILT